MLRKIDLSEIKKLAVFLIAIVIVTILTAFLSRGLYGGKDSNFKIKNQNSIKTHFAVKNESQSEDALKIENYEVYQLRDPFTPLGSADAPQSQSHMAAGISEILPKVKDVYVKEGKEKAKVFYNGKIMILSEGQEYGHFSVVDINSQDKKVTIIYGDEKVVLKEKSQINLMSASKSTNNTPEISGPSSVLGTSSNN
jgi:hypothetical protein